MWKIFIFFLLLACSVHAQVFNIDLERTFSRKSQLLLSEFAEREIGKYGIDPDEYRQERYFDGKFKQVIAISSNGRDFCEYDLNGIMTRSILRPQRVDIVEGVHLGLSNAWWLTNNIFLDKNTVVYYNDNVTGSAEHRLIIADVKGKVLKTFANPYSFVPRAGTFSTGGQEVAFFYHYGSNTLFFENCNDTVYRVSMETITPRYYLKMGKYKPPYAMKGSLPFPKDNPLENRYFTLNKMGESDKFLFFNILHQRNSTNPNPYSRYSFFGYYDKK